MINPAELRIGNWINAKYRKYNDDKVYWMHKQADRKDIFDMSDFVNLYEPIPLTESILIACGFKLKDGAYLAPHKDADTGFFDKYNFSLYNGKLDDSFCVNSNPYDGEYIECTSLHKLQNIWYMLFGEEIIYKP